jgi:hypothetical protein
MADGRLHSLLLFPNRHNPPLHPAQKSTRPPAGKQVTDEFRIRCGCLAFVLAFAVASVVAVALLVVIPEGDLLLSFAFAVAFAFAVVFPVVIPKEPALSEVEWAICCCPSKRITQTGHVPPL